MIHHAYKKFTKDQRGTFRYWYWHWKAFNAIAWKGSVWKPHHLLHDIEKPFLKIFLPYKKVQAIHRRNNKHHLEYKHPDKRNWVDMVIDWECSRYTKEACPRDSLQEATYLIENNGISYEDYCKFVKAWRKIFDSADK